MKKIFYVAGLLFLLSCSVTTTSKNADIAFKDSEKFLGVLGYYNETVCSFKFENPGETPLIIQNVETSCGCTVADWPMRPIKPGGDGEIKIKYNADFPGVFHKTITVHYNGEESPAILKISGQVSYPANLE